MPTAEEGEAFRASALVFLAAYSKLSAWAVENDRMLFPRRPKFHYFHHMSLHARYFNPRFSWCFKAEDYVGRMSKVAASVAMGNRVTRVPLKFAHKYQHLLHLRLVRPRFEDD